ncbi:MAG: MFS transporter, partial [Acidimicrobiales bacterium]
SAAKTGFAFLPFSAGIITGATLASRLLPRIGPRTLMMAGLVTAGLGLAWFTQLHFDSSYVTHLLPAEVVVSVGMGLTFVPMSSTALIGVDPKDAGVASALVNTTQQVGSSLGTALLNTIAASAASSFVLAHPHLSHLAQAAPVHGYTTGFTVSACLILMAALAAGVLIRAGRDEVEIDPDGELESLLDADETFGAGAAAPELVLSAGPA